MSGKIKKLQKTYNKLVQLCNGIINQLVCSSYAKFRSTEASSLLLSDAAVSVDEKAAKILN